MNPNDVIRKYQLLEKIGEGGMGVVWKAHDIELDRPVVIKAIHEDFALHTELRKRFIDEARIQARLVHPNICTLFDAFEENRQLFLVMELIEGHTLKDLIAAEHGPLPVARTVEIAQGVLNGLHFAYQHGVVHRDIKPSNIMVDTLGHVKIMDFGIAKAAGAERMGKTKTGMTVGTPEYMSPEQILGQDVDARSDIYSFGIMLYEMLTGTLPFEHTSNEYEIQHFHVAGAIPSASAGNRRIPDWLDGVAQRCMAKLPADRFNSAELALKALQEISPLRSPVHTQATPVSRPVRKPKRFWNAADALVFGIVAVAGIAYLLRTEPITKPAPHPKQVQPKPSTSPVIAARAREQFLRELARMPQELTLPMSGIALRLIPAGSFVMGSPASEADRYRNEQQHTVRISKPFYMGVYEVTQGQWQNVMGSNPSKFKSVGENAPVEKVSWDDCQEFLQKLSVLEGLPAGTLRLPTEAEWEYACRAGTTTPFHYGACLDSSMANFNGNSPYGGAQKGVWRKKTTPVGSFEPNAWGLYDMHGNVCEWCGDWYGEYSGDATDLRGPASGSLRVFRGGSWYGRAWNCRSAYRYSVNQGDVGFRLSLPAGQ